LNLICVVFVSRPRYQGTSRLVLNLSLSKVLIAGLAHCQYDTFIVHCLLTRVEVISSNSYVAMSQFPTDVRQPCCQCAVQYRPNVCLGVWLEETAMFMENCFIIYAFCPSLNKTFSYRTMYSMHKVLEKA